MPKEWTASLEQRGGNLYAQFDRDVVLKIFADVAHAEYWDEWSKVRVPTLLIAGEMGIVPNDDCDRMLTLNPAASFCQVAGGGHDVHLDRPAECKRLIGDFMDSLTWRPTTGCFRDALGHEFRALPKRAKSGHGR